MTQIHSTAVVDQKAELGSNVQVGPYSVIGPNAKIGDDTIIGPHVVVEGNTEIGKKCRILQFASIGSIPQDLKYHGEPSRLVIGEGNTIREFVTMNPGTEHGGMITRIGDRNLFMACCHVAHDCQVGNDNVFANSAALAGHVTLGNHVVVGGMVGIHQFVRIGDFVMLAAGSMVGQDVPTYCIAQGDHAELRGINIIALRRNGFSEADISGVKRSFRLIFAHSGKLDIKINQLPDELKNNPKIATILEFIQNSKRGICSASMSFDSE